MLAAEVLVGAHARDGLVLAAVRTLGLVRLTAAGLIDGHAIPPIRASRPFDNTPPQSRARGGATGMTVDAASSRNWA